MGQTPLFRRFAAALAACALLAACGGEEPARDPQAAADASAAKVAAPAAPGGGRFAGEIQRLATSKPLPCPAGFFSGTDTFTVNSAADTTFHMPGGHALELPAGSVATGTQFVVTRAIADTAALDISVIPEGVQPDTVVYLTVNYAPCVAPGDSTGKILVRDSSGTYKTVGTANKNRKVTGALDHFSTYIVAGN